MIHILPNSWWQTTQHDDKTFSSVNYSLIGNQSNPLSSWQHIDEHKKNYTLLSTKNTSWYVIMEMFVLEILILEICGTLMNNWWFFVVLWVEIFGTLMNNWWFFMYCEWEYLPVGKKISSLGWPMKVHSLDMCYKFFYPVRSQRRIRS
jgi:hypothetical protein